MATMGDDQMNGAKDAWEFETGILSHNAEVLSDLADKAVIIAAEGIVAIEALEKVKGDLERVFKTAADLRVSDALEPAKTDMLRVWAATLDKFTHAVISLSGAK